ncbi:MAG TPA: protein-disulfide reductase DsbD domain-containing protein [Candidatus Binataceae bacterium]|nr:protein-disulfide reductase DsbD domain-containing protein [Candidatus Binataceae bacterium]
MNLRKFLLMMIAVAMLTGTKIARADSILDKLDKPAADQTAVVRGGDVWAVIKPDVAQATPGQDIKVSADFIIGSGWHIYGKPISTDYVPTNITFDKEMVAEQSIDFPKPEMMKFEALGQTLPVYKDKLHVGGDVKLRRDLKPGDYQLSGKVEFQECSDTICKIPQSLPFAIPITVASSAH